jgi:hypothetical protein
MMAGLVPKPLFVLGKHRSGTTWLANQLCQHSKIAGVRHARHYGIHESAYFSVVEGRYGDLREWSNYVEFAEAMAASDYFRLAGADARFIYELWPSDYAQVFRAIMNRVAEREDATVWLEKSPPHTVLVERLAELFPDAKFVGVKRPAIDVVSSTLAFHPLSLSPSPRERIRRLWLIVRTIVSWSYYNRTMERYTGFSDRLLVVEYDALRGDLRRTLEAVSCFLGLRYETGMTESFWPPNTSFGDMADRDCALGPAEVRVARVAEAMLRPVPFAFVRALDRIWRRLHGRRALPEWFYRLARASQSAKTVARGASRSVEPGS